MFSRLELLVGDKINLIHNKTILIVGLGGVGSYAVEGLVRSGIENFIIVDYDKIDISNLNRQLMTNQSNIGEFKTDEIEKRILSINPNCKIIKFTKRIDKDNINELFEFNIDYVVDACDTLEVKLDLIRICKSKNIKLIASMGTGNKMDPSRLKIMDIRKTNYDRIAKVLRKMIRKEKISGKVMVICSDEKAIVKSNSDSRQLYFSASSIFCWQTVRTIRSQKRSQRSLFQRLLSKTATSRSSRTAH